MSRAFVRNDAEDDEVIVPPRAPLPPGTPNYVTPRGLVRLRAEQEALEAERARLQASGGEAGQRPALAMLNGRLAALVERIASARLVNLPDPPPAEIRFGASVTLRLTGGTQAGETRRYTIVGVDEADAAEGRLAFTAPLARALLGSVAGGSVSVQTSQTQESFEILKLEYLQQGE